MDTPDQIAFDLGWDYSTFDLNVPEAANKLFCDGYRAFASGNNKTSHQPDKYVRKWLQIRFGALSRGKDFSHEITPDYLEEITPVSGICPVIEEPFTYSTGMATDWSVDRANNERGYAKGNILIISQLANAAKSDKPLDEIQALGQQGREVDGLEPRQWERLGLLIEPAFGDHHDELNAILSLRGQPIALGMPISPLASFQAMLATTMIAGWDHGDRRAVNNFIIVFGERLCVTKSQRSVFKNLIKAVIKRSKHVRSFSALWATVRVQRRLFKFVDAIGGAGMTRLVELIGELTGDQDTKMINRMQE